MVNAILLAGTSTKKTKLIEEYDGQGAKNKGLVTVNNVDNQPVILDVLQALQNSRYIDKNKITIIGPKQKLENIINNPNVLILQEESTLFENAKKAYKEISTKGEKTFITSCDVPFIGLKNSRIKSNPIDEFILKCEDYDADFYWSLVNIKNIPNEIEQLKKSAKLHLRKKGNYRAGNMSMIKGTKIRDSELFASQIESAFEKRRTTNLFARLELYGSLLGPYWWEFLKHSCGCLTDQKAEYAIKRELGINFKLINVRNPCSAIDIDYQRDYDFIKENYKYLKQLLKNYSMPG